MSLHLVVGKFERTCLLVQAINEFIETWQGSGCNKSGWAVNACSQVEIISCSVEVTNPCHQVVPGLSHGGSVQGDKAGVKGDVKAYLRGFVRSYKSCNW